MIMTPPESNIQLPKAVTVAAKPGENILVTLDKKHKLAVNDRWVKRSHLEQALRTELAQNPEQMVLIRADKNVKHKNILQLLHRVKRAGARHIALATEQKSRVDL